eukprot:scaffold215124_cov24-Tisochrysis_lutea.AAC.2
MAVRVDPRFVHTPERIQGPKVKVQGNQGYVHTLVHSGSQGSHELFYDERVWGPLSLLDPDLRQMVQHMIQLNPGATSLTCPHNLPFQTAPMYEGLLYCIKIPSFFCTPQLPYVQCHMAFEPSTFLPHHDGVPRTT